MLKKVILKGIKLYQKFFSPFFSTFFNVHCRYYPSCSEYARLAILEWGIFKGSYLALKRFFRCNPFSPGGIDFPPSKKSFKREKFYGQ